jgi:hypothetical protein
LGDVAIPEDGRRAIAKAVERQLCGNTDFFESDLDQDSAEWVLIDWSERTALPELLETRITKSSKDRLYRTSDELMKHRKVLEKKLRDHEQTLFDLQRSLVLYDGTNTYFEGICAANPKAKHGKNKQKRNDCRQVSIGSTN